MKQEEINNIFSKIANYYDRVNNLISFGMHMAIKKNSVKMLEIKNNSKVVDLCCGSGDFVKIISKMHQFSEVIGVDNCENMLKAAKIKNPNRNFIKADCTKLPFENSSVDFVTMGFGLRNIVDRNQALNEIYRILKNKGKFLHLDFGENNFLNKIFDCCIPNLVKVLGYDKECYLYLVKSKNNFLKPNDLIKEFEKFGFKLIKSKNYLFGAISAQVMQKII